MVASLTMAEISKSRQLDGTGGHGICGALEDRSLDFAMFQPKKVQVRCRDIHDLKWHYDFKETFKFSAV